MTDLADQMKSRVWAWELDDEVDGEPIYLSQWTPGGYSTTTDPREAILFARRSDALSILPMLDYDFRRRYQDGPTLRCTMLHVDISMDLV